jgi:glycosyltransferase involved in cell wall biosynthesis
VHHIEGYPLAVTWRERLWRRAAELYFPWMGKRAAAFRVVNSEVGQTLQTLGVPPSKIRLLYSLYLDFEIYKPHDTVKKYDILFVGRLASNKGILVLIEALTQITATHPQVLLAIRGSGALHATIKARIAAAGIEQHVLFLPHVEKADDMAQLYQQARMLVCASTVEGNPRVTIEAMACGVPVISTPVGIMPEVIQHGQNGLLFDGTASELAQNMRLLLDNAGLRDTMGAAGRQAVQRFAADTVIRDYALAYHSLIEQK